jgi:hypothetical protein
MQPFSAQPLHPTSAKRRLSSPKASPRVIKRAHRDDIIGEDDEAADSDRLGIIIVPKRTNARISALQAELYSLRLNQTRTEQDLKNAENSLEHLQQTVNRTASEQKTLHQDRVDHFKAIFAAASCSSRALIDASFSHGADFLFTDLLGLVDTTQRQYFSICEGRADEIVASATKRHREGMAAEQERIRQLTHDIHEIQCQMVRLETELGVLTDVVRARPFKRMLSGLDDSALSGIRD